MVARPRNIFQRRRVFNSKTLLAAVDPRSGTFIHRHYKDWVRSSILGRRGMLTRCIRGSSETAEKKARRSENMYTSQGAIEGIHKNETMKDLSQRKSKTRDPNEVRETPKCEEKLGSSEKQNFIPITGQAPGKLAVSGNSYGKFRCHSFSQIA